MDGLKKDLLSDACADSAILGRAEASRGYCLRSAAPAGARDRDRSRHAPSSSRPAHALRTVAVFLVALAALLAAPPAASAQTTVWSATLTAGESRVANIVAGVGYDRVAGANTGSLDDNSFDLAGTTYTVTGLVILLPDSDAILRLVLDTGLPAAVHPHLTLHLGSASIPLADATVGANRDEFEWTGHGLSWSNNDMISVSLTSTPPPAVSSVAFTSAPGADNTYAIDDAVEATVTFDAAVDITGTPQLELDFDGTAKAAACATGTNTTTMACSYTVVVGDSAPNGVAIAANKLTGGTIYATGSTTITADLDHVLVAIDAGHKVDGIRPTLVTAGDNAPQTSADGTQVIFTINEDVGSVDVSGIILFSGQSIGAGATASFSGRTVTVTLIPVFTIQHGQTVTLRLLVAGVRDTVGNGNLSIGVQPVTNKVPQPPAAITGVEITSDPGMDSNYATGDDIEVTATFDQAVAVTGKPRIKLRLIGGTTRGDRWAEYASGSGTTALVFAYPVVATEESDTSGIEVGDPSLQADNVDLNGGTITVVASGENASLSYAPLFSDSGHRVNWARPTLSGAVTSTDGTKVLLTFSENLDEIGLELSLFTVKVGGTAVTLSGTAPTVSGRVVTLTLATALTSATQAVTVSYADPTTGDDPGTVEDLAFNDADSFTDQMVTNRFGLPEVSSVAFTSVPGSDNTYGIADAVEATVTFDAAVDITGFPALEMDFDGTAKAASCATGTNTTTMACSYTVAVNDSAPNGVAIAANKLTGGTITATGSTTVSADLDHAAVPIDANHKVDGIRPTLVTTGAGAPKTSTDGTKVILTFSEDISAADQTKITIQANSVTVSTTAASATGTKVELTLTTALTTTATNLTVELAADAVDDAAGNGILAVAATTVTNAVVTTTAPTVTAVALTSDPGSDNTYGIGEDIEATVTFSAAVDITAAPQLELDFDGSAKAASCATGTNTTTMACEYEVAVGDSAPNGVAIAANKLTGGTITATGSTTITADLDHVAVAIDAGQKVDGIRPTLVTTGNEAPTTSTDGTQVILTFSETISAVDHTKITIMANSVTAATSAASVTGTKVELTLTTALTTTATNLTVELSADAVDDAASNGILAVAATTVTNAVVTTTAPTVTAVALTSTPGSDSTYAIGDDVQATVTFDAAVDITGTPQLELDFDGTAKAAGCTTATNTTTMACSYTVLVGDSAPNGVAIAANKLTGGTIYATGSTTTSADLDHVAVAIDANHKVDGIRPTLVTTGSDAPKTSTDGEAVFLAFSEDIGAVSHSDITIQANSVNLSTTMASVAGTKVEITLTTALTTTATNLTVALAADAVDDAAGNGILAVAATAVTNAVGTTVSNAVPTFANPTETRSVAENSAAATNVGAPVTATDTDSGDTLTYTLEGTDAASFTIVATSGQIRTRSGVTYDYEAQPSYSVTVKVDDGNGGTDMVTVTIELTNDVNERPLAPAAPRVTATPNTTDSLTVSWSAPSNTGRPAIESYDLQYREGTTGSWTEGPQNETGTSATITGLTADPAAYQVQVRATNDDGDGPWSPPGSIRTTPPPPPVGPPSPPRVLTAMAGDQAVQLSWSRPVDDGGTRIVRYEYRQQEGDGPVGEWQIIGEDRPTTDHRVTGLTNGVSYTFHVRAVNNGGWASPPSEPATATPMDPSVPATVTLRAAPAPAEGGEPVTVTATLDKPAPADGLTVMLTTGGTATRDIDYTLSSTTITLAAGETAGTVTLTVTDDAEDDGAETIVLYAASTTPALTAEPLTLTIEDNDVTPVPALPLLGQLLLALGLGAAGARVTRLRQARRRR